MPELPEVETVCRGLARKLMGRRLAHVEARRPDLRFPLPRDFKARLEGRRIKGVRRRAKYILLDLDDGNVLVIHLGMSGSLVLTQGRPNEIRKHDHVLLATDNDIWVRFNDPRRFGLMDIVKGDELDRHKLFKGLGVEPLGRALNGECLAELLRGKKTDIKAALMDQRLIVGIGNIYVSEILFRAGIGPKRRAGTIRDERAAKLAAAIKRVLKEAIASGGSSLRDYVQADGELGYFQHRWRVYDRQGKACPGCTCDIKKTGGIKRITQAGRSTFYCPRKQT
jgi:formamidopyrimidine-DNA glycosylase